VPRQAPPAVQAPPPPPKPAKAPLPAVAPTSPAAPPPRPAPPADDNDDAWTPHRKAATEGGFYEVCPDFDAQLQFALDNAQEGDLEGMAAAAAAATDPRQRAVYAYVVAAVRARAALQASPAAPLPQMQPTDLDADAARADALDREAAHLRRELARSARDADSVTDEMREDVMALLDDLGVPYIVAPMEAEAQCAALELAGLVEGTITDDSDAFCFGAKKVYKNIFDDKKYVEAYFAEDCRRELKLGRPEFVSLALLLGGDYASGVKGVGIVNGMEVLQAFHFPHPRESDDIEAAVASLQKFGSWLDDVGNVQLHDAHASRFAKRHRTARSRWEAPPAFPSREAAQAYIKPRVADQGELARQLGRDLEAWDPQSTQRLFNWREPDEQRLRKRCALELNWAPSTAAAVLDPVFKKWAERKAGRQRRVDAFFDSYHSNQKNDTHASKRLRRALDEATPAAEASGCGGVGGGGGGGGGRGGRGGPAAAAVVACRRRGGFTEARRGVEGWGLMLWLSDFVIITSRRYRGVSE
jgi:DNA excision repair protein ERCC-5